MFLKCAMLLVTSEILLNQFNYFHFFLTISNLSTEGFFEIIHLSWNDSLA